MEELGLTRAKLAEKYRGTAEKQVRRQLILAQIVKQEGLTLTDEEWDEGFQMLADTFKQPKEDLKEYYQSNEEQLELFKHSLLEKKAIKLIIDTSAIEEAEPGQETVVEATET
jgi:trigger factor